MILARKSLLAPIAAPLCGALLAAAPLHAQQTAQQSACTIDETSSGDLAVAQLALSRAANAAVPAADRAKSLRDAVKRITDKKDNPSGRSLLLGRALMLWAQQPGVGPTAKRGDLGFPADKDQQVQLLAAADSAFTAVETAMPACAAVVATARQAEPWLGTVQAALSALAANQLDTAEALARRSLVVNRSSPYAYHVLANVARSRRDTKAAIGYWKQAIETSRSDTGDAVVRQRAYFDLGVAASEAAQAASGAERAALAKDAADAYRAFLTEAPTSSDAPVVMTRLANLLTAMGDSAAVPSVYADALANPSRYDDIALAQAGVIASRANRLADAAKLYEAALKVNPQQRDALYNLAATYSDMGRPADMIDVTRRLVAVEPSNPEDWMLFAYAYQGLGRAAKDQKLVRAYTDSLLKYKTLADSMPVKVTVTQFTRGAERSTLKATVENRSATPKTYQLRVEFLDKAGNVIATQQASVGPVPAKQSAPVIIAVEKGGAAAYRFAPLG